MKNTVVISCWFGEKYNKPSSIKSWFDLKVTVKATIKSCLPSIIASWAKIESVIPAKPDGAFKSVFFTNNRSLKREILNKGWEYIYIDKGIQNGESIDSSLQAKEVKFLQLDSKILDVLFNYKYIVYMDSRRITDKITELTTLCKKGILIRFTPRVKNSIWDEVQEAKGQERYERNMGKTIQFIDEKLSEEYSGNNRVMNTGVIVYKIDDLGVRDSILKLCDEVYSACIELDQPECQIFWCLFSQKYNEIITKTEFSTVTTRTGL